MLVCPAAASSTSSARVRGSRCAALTRRSSRRARLRTTASACASTAPESKETSMPMSDATGSPAAIKPLVDEWLEMLDGIRKMWGEEAVELAQDAYLLGRKVGFHE